MANLYVVSEEGDNTGGMLPGFSPPAKKPGPIHAAATKTIDWLRDQGALDGRHELMVELILSNALAVDHGLRTDRTSIATTNLYGKLVELLDKLPVPAQASDDQDADFWAAVASAAPPAAS